MQELEKILEEINAEFDRRIGTRLKIIAGTNDDVYRYGYGKSLEAYQQGKLFVEDNIRKHMNDGWTPADERLPEDGTYICTLDGELCGLEEPFTGMCGIEKGIWDEPDCVIAWRPLPEPYIPKTQNKPEDHYPEWRAKFLNKFDRRE